jgi:hypothetical protein
MARSMIWLERRHAKEIWPANQVTQAVTSPVPRCAAFNAS